MDLKIREWSIECLWARVDGSWSSLQPGWSASVPAKVVLGSGKSGALGMLGLWLSVGSRVLVAAWFRGVGMMESSVLMCLMEVRR